MVTNNVITQLAVHAEHCAAILRVVALPAAMLRLAPIRSLTAEKPAEELICNAAKLETQERLSASSKTQSSGAEFADWVPATADT